MKRKKQKTITPPEPPLFFLTFCGEFISILTKLNTSQTIETKEGIIDQTLPITFSGYLLDMDHEYYYLGDSPEAINKSIKIKDVSIIQIDNPDPPKMSLPPPNAYDSMLDRMPTPTRKEDVN